MDWFADALRRGSSRCRRSNHIILVEFGTAKSYLVAVLGRRLSQGDPQDMQDYLYFSKIRCRNSTWDEKIVWSFKVVQDVID